MRTFGLVQNGISLVSYGTLLVHFSPWAVAVLVLAGLPAFIAEAKFSGDAFRLFRWRSPETRMQIYLETVLAREDHAKEVKLFGLGPLFLERYRDIFRKLYREDRALTIRRDAWGFGLGLIATAALYGAYAWIALATIAARITLGQMTMYLMLFRQGQSAVSASLSAIGGMYEDNLYLSTLYEYLETPVDSRRRHVVRGPHPEDGVRFEDVELLAIRARASRRSIDVNLHIKPGRIARARRRERLGQDHADQAAHAALPADRRAHPARRARPARVGRGARCAQRIGVIFQDFARYQMLRRRERRRRRRAALRGRGALARGRPRRAWRSRFIETLPAGYHTQLGKWFKDGRELSGGQWQKIALSRAFMRTRADILVLDEPTAAMDAAAEAKVFEHFRALTRRQDRDPDLAPLLDGAHGRPDRRARATAASSSAAATRS